MSNYYFLDNHNRLEFLGEFANDFLAWEYADYSEDPINFVCIFDESKLLNLRENIDKVIN